MKETYIIMETAYTILDSLPIKLFPILIATLNEMGESVKSMPFFAVFSFTSQVNLFFLFRKKRYIL